MSFEGVLLFRAAVADVRAHQDQRRLEVLVARLFDRLGNFFSIVAALYVSRVPAIGLEALGDVLSERQVHSAGQRNMVLVVEKDQLAELQMAGERSGFLADAFHEIAVAADTVGVVIDDRVAGLVKPCREPGFGDGESDRVTKTLAQRTRRYFYPGRMAALRMAGCFAAPLPKPLQFFERQIVAGEIEQAVEQHRAVPGGKNEAVAVEPFR